MVEIEVEPKTVAIGAIAIVIIAAAAFFLIGGGHKAPGSATSASTTVSGSNSPVTAATTTISNGTNPTLALMNSNMINITYAGYEATTQRQSGWYQSNISASNNYSFVFHYEKYGNYSRVNFQINNQPNSTYLFSPNKNTLCAGPYVFASNNFSDPYMKCTVLDASQAQQIMGFVLIGNHSFTGPGANYSIQRFASKQIASYKSSAYDHQCQYASGIVMDGNSSQNTSFNQCVSGTYNIPVNYNITYRRTVGAVNAIGGITNSTIHIYGVLRSVNSNVSQSYVQMTG